MTLAYAQHVGSVISVVSDTGVTEHEMPLGKRDQVPKIVILTPDLCVAFSGVVALAHQYIDGFHAEVRKTVPAIVGYFEECARASGGQVDFLIMFNKPIVKMIRIAHGQSGRVLRAAFIGDKPGFEAFQYNREHRAIPGVFPKTMFLTTTLVSERDKGNPTFMNLGAMIRVVSDVPSPAVFGDAIAVNNVDGSFRYRPYAAVISPNMPKVAVPPAYMMQAQPELVEDARYSLACFSSAPGTAKTGVAMHHVFGKLTYLYSADAGQPLTMTEVITGKNFKEFIESHTDGYGRWDGTINTRLPPPPDYGMEFIPQVMPQHMWTP